MTRKSSEKIIARVDSALADLIPGFLENRKSDVSAIRMALASGDFDTIRSLGHTMKGSGGGYGFDPITDMGAVLETAAKNRDEDTIRQYVARLSSYIDQVDVVFE